MNEPLTTTPDPTPIDLDEADASVPQHDTVCLDDILDMSTEEPVRDGSAPRSRVGSVQTPPVETVNIEDLLYGD